jgi:hypothetical protein
MSFGDTLLKPLLSVAAVGGLCALSAQGLSPPPPAAIHSAPSPPPTNTQPPVAGAGQCAAKGTMAVVPHRGDALLFWDMHPNGTEVDRASLHASCPTLKVGFL